VVITRDVKFSESATWNWKIALTEGPKQKQQNGMDDGKDDDVDDD
jgi:hypothetical protein